MSSKLECVEFGAVQTTVIVPPLTIYSLPQKLLNKIFYDLSKNDLQAAMCACRDLCTRVRASINFKEPLSVRNFINILSRTLNKKKYPVQQEKLTELEQKINSQSFDNLMLLKGYILDLKTQLINVIKTLDKETADDLRNRVQAPYFFKDTFILAEFETYIDAANLIPDITKRGWQLRYISEDLIKAKKMDKAIVVATSIPEESMRGYALEKICKVLAEAKKIDRAISVATSIANENRRGDALEYISKALIRAGEFDRAIDFAKSIPNEAKRGWQLRYISEFLIKKAGEIERAVAVATSIPNEAERRYAHKYISDFLTKKRAQENERALADAASISDDDNI